MSKLDEPASLVTNVSQPKFRAISLRVVGKQLARDAIGARVSIKSGTLAYERQLTAGNGYHASNEQTLILAVESEKASLSIVWPGGKKEIYEDVTAGSDYVAVEDAGHLFLVPK